MGVVMAGPTAAQRMNFGATFKALASEHRREILRIIGDSTPEQGNRCCSRDEVCACKLSERLGLGAPTISHHMSVLHSAGLVDARKDGLWTYYTLRREALGEVARSLTEL